MARAREGRPARRVALARPRPTTTPSSFWTGVVTALRRAVPGIGERALELLHRLARLDRPGAHRACSTSWPWRPARCGWCSTTTTWSTTAQIGRGLTFLLEHLPPQVHVVLSTRADPDLPLARWRVRGELVEIRAADLRFTSGEAAAYLDEATGVRLTAEQVAGARGPHRGLDRRPAARRHLVAGARGRRGLHRRVRRRRPLRRSTTSSRRCSPTSRSRCATSCSARRCSTGSPARCATRCSTATTPAAMLQTLERANLFLVALDDRREWYRYHQLFADVLRARLPTEQPEQVPVLHLRASQWYEQHDLTDEAVSTRWRQATSTGPPPSWSRPCRDPPAAARGHGAGLAGGAARRHGAAQPGAERLRGGPAMIAGDLDAVEPRLDDAEARSPRRPPTASRPWPDTDELRTLPATIAMYRASLAQAHGDVEGTARARPARPRPRRPRRPPRPWRCGRLPGPGRLGPRRRDAGAGDVRAGGRRACTPPATSSTS